MSTTSRKLKRIRERAIASVAVPKTEEACASFSRKFNLANYDGPPYEAIDFFASRKLVCPASIVRMVSEALFQECVEEVEFAARQYMIAAKARGWKSMTPPPITGKGDARGFDAWQAKRKGA